MTTATAHADLNDYSCVVPVMAPRDRTRAILMRVCAAAISIYLAAAILTGFTDWQTSFWIVLAMVVASWFAMLVHLLVTQGNTKITVRTGNGTTDHANRILNVVRDKVGSTNVSAIRSYTRAGERVLSFEATVGAANHFALQRDLRAIGLDAIVDSPF